MKEEKNYPPPVYPKPNPEYDAWCKAQFLKKVQNTRWDDPDERPYKPRGRKPKPSVRIETKPRSESEARVVNQKYNWLD